MKGKRRSEEKTEAKTQEAYRVGLQPSASRSDILIECSFPFGKESTWEVPSEPARYGSAFHALMALLSTARVRGEKVQVHPSAGMKIAKKYGLPLAYDELKTHARASEQYWHDWLGGKNEFKLSFEAERKASVVFIEKAIALFPLQGGRLIAPHDDDHRYHGLQEGELAGTLDHAQVHGKRRLPVLVNDHKTGDTEDFSRPTDKAQLLTLAAGMMRLAKQEEAIVSVLHSRRRGLPKVYAEKVKLSELKRYERRLQTGLSRIGDGTMKPGKWCKWCPWKDACPAHNGRLLESAGDVLTGLTAAGGALSKQGLAANDLSIIKAPAGELSRDRKLGLLYSIVKKAETLAERARAEIRTEMQNDPTCLPVTPEGVYLTLRAYEREVLSKGNIILAYGQLKGEAMLEKLRNDGAIVKQPVTQLWPMQERGGM